MATFYRCDRCRREGKNRTEIGLSEVVIPSASFRDGKTVDLCERCRVALHDFVAPLPDVREG